MMRWLLALVAVLSLFQPSFGLPGTTARLRQAALHLQSFTKTKPTLRTPVALQTDACLDAWTNLVAVLEPSACGNITQIYATNLTGIDVQGITENYCDVADATTGKTCQEKVALAITAFSTSCSGPGLNLWDPSDIASLWLWIVVARVPCVKVNNDLCFPIFREQAEVLGAVDDGSDFTPALLAGACVPCVGKVLDELATWGGREYVWAASQLKIACTQRDNVYCFPVFMAATSGLDGNDDNTTFTDDILDGLCDPCTILIAYRSYWTEILLGGNFTKAQEIKNFLDLSAFICQKNEQNDYCIVKVQDYDFSTAGDVCNPATNPDVIGNCPSTTCGSTLRQFKSDMGCCMGTWFGFLEWFSVNDPTGYADDFNISPAVIEGLIEDTCQVTIPDGCARKRLDLVLTVGNIAKDWYTSNKAEFESTFRQVLAWTLGAELSNVVVTGSHFDDSKNAIVVDVTVTGFSDADVNRFNVYLANALQVSQDSNFVISGVKDPNTPGQLVNLNTPVTVTAQSTTVVCNDPNASPPDCNFAFALAPSFSILLLLVASLLSFFN